MQNIQTMSDLTNFLNTLSYNDFKNIVEQYSNKNNVNFDSQMETLVTNSLETKLHNLKVNCTCLTYYCLMLQYKLFNFFLIFLELKY